MLFAAEASIACISESDRFLVAAISGDRSVGDELREVVHEEYAEVDEADDGIDSKRDRRRMASGAVVRMKVAEDWR